MDYSVELKSKQDCINFLDGLNSQDKLFHLDDDPKDIIYMDESGGFKGLFTEEECEHLRKRQDEIFDYLEDPHSTVMELYYTN